MAIEYKKIEWQETKNDVTIDCSLDIAVHPARSKIVLLIVPGVDGSVDGYKNKYVKITESIQELHGAAVVRIANPFITSFHWESNIRRALDYIHKNAHDITGSDDAEIRIMAHSAGAAVIVRIAHEYPGISALLLINPAIALGFANPEDNANTFTGKVTILLGEKDPAYKEINNIRQRFPEATLQTVPGADHHFSGNAFQYFLEAPQKHLF